VHLHAPPLDVVVAHTACRRLEATVAALGGRSMHDPASELPRIPLPRTRVNNALRVRGAELLSVALFLEKETS
jgi:hypothetical protein